MKIRQNFHKLNAEVPHIPSTNFLEDRIGFWGIVTEVNSVDNTVTVISDTGYEFENIPVYSKEWVTVDKTKDYIPSTRNLPPKNSWVFVLTPTYTANGAFVLCSGFTRGDENIRTLWAQSNDEIETKNNCRETKTQGGWDITEEYANGNFKAESNDGKIKLSVNTVEDSAKSQLKEVSLTAWSNIITINEDGISITDKNNNIIEATSSGLKITDANSNVFESTKNEFDITVGNSVVAVKNKKVTINGHLEVTA